MAETPIVRGTELERNLAWLTEAISKAEPSAVASLVRERRITLAELAEVPANAGRSTRNEIADKRAARRATAQAAKAPAGGRNKRAARRATAQAAKAPAGGRNKRSG